MKKLLGILGAIAFTASVGSTVVACGTSSSSDNNHLSSTIDWNNGDEEVITLSDGQVIRVKDFPGMKGSSGLDDYLLDQVNGKVANSYASDYNDRNITTNTNGNLGLISKNRDYSLQGSKVNGYQQEIDNFNSVSVSTNLYQEYVNSLLTPLPMDEDTKEGNNILLNPVWYGTDFSGDRDYSIWFKAKDGSGQYTRWTTARETSGAIRQDAKAMKYLPTPEILNTYDFYLVKDAKAPNGDNGNKITKVDDVQKAAITGQVGGVMTGQQALMYRFQDYLQKTNSNSMINALVMEYAKNSLYKLQGAPSTGATPWEQATNKSLYVDTSSQIAKDIQSWPGKDSDPITSNYKMVWRFAVDSKQKDTINNAINGLVSINDSLSNNNFAVFNSGTTISKVFSALTQGGIKNLSEKGSDPFFDGTETGYQGIVKDGKAIDGGTLNIDSTAAGNIAKTEGFGVLKSANATSGIPTYDWNSVKNNYSDFVIVMPLYLMDLLNSSKNNTTETNTNIPTDPLSLVNIATNNWIELQPQLGNSWKSTDKFDFSNSGLEKYDSSKEDINVLPTKSSYLTTKDNKNYIFIANDDPAKNFSIKDTTTNQTITVAPNAKPADTGYGIKGAFSTSSDDKAAQSFNGQQVNYSIHLGLDKNNPSTYQDSWTNDHADQNVADIANLSDSKKEDVMNTLLALVAKNDSSLQEETKNSIYRNYISLDDIYYKGLYDKLSKYLKEDDSTDESD